MKNIAAIPKILVRSAGAAGPCREVMADAITDIIDVLKETARHPSGAKPRVAARRVVPVQMVLKTGFPRLFHYRPRQPQPVP